MTRGSIEDVGVTSTPNERIDSHQHFWAYNQTDYVWMGPEHTILRRDYLPDDLAPLLSVVDDDPETPLVYPL